MYYIFIHILCVIIKNTTTSYATTTATLSREDSGSSTGGDVGASSTIYWNEYTISSGGQQVAAVKLIKAIGRWYIYQSGVVLSNLLVQGLQQGWRSPEGSVVDSLYHVPATYTSVTQTYTFSPIEEDALWCMLSFNMTCNWQRGTGSKYPFEFINCQKFV
ncbi:hypothetical protein [Ruminiclostridium cellobioparum]|uniref:Uncharacterized protein n=1 Tax=Ruminiclostridium cellobioparum subsp. termitidis CT1112 TaxID=1195236 RepID=S0G093_RUMCE|nr:hypothetical protein [Ruminiclostridium cellobioparum]EMS74228.1 hypothetical protein CTER_0041 [Ruminiclostridium cellobioparum subsp. termitidis CT1112]